MPEHQTDDAPHLPQTVCTVLAALRGAASTDSPRPIAPEPPALPFGQATLASIRRLLKRYDREGTA
jgi:hypothetical protein